LIFHRHRRHVVTNLDFAMVAGMTMKKGSSSPSSWSSSPKKGDFFPLGLGQETKRL